MDRLPIVYEPVDRLVIIQELINVRRYRKYLEIGCDTDSVFAHLFVDHRVGVDPRRGGNMRMTSDEYFEQHQDKFDIIFIDGLHYYDQVKKDIKHSLERLEPGGIIIIHDCLPTSPLEAVIPMPEPLVSAWTGDVWRINFDLMCQPNIKYHVLNSPYGLGCVSPTNDKNTSDSVEKGKDWNFYSNNWQKLPIVSCREALLMKFRNIIAEI